MAAEPLLVPVIGDLFDEEGEEIYFRGLGSYGLLEGRCEEDWGFFPGLIHSIRP